MGFSLFVDSDIGISSSDKLNFTRVRNFKLNVVKIHDFSTVITCCHINYLLDILQIKCDCFKLKSNNF